LRPCIGLFGAPGSGKSTIAQLLVDHHGYRQAGFSDRPKAFAYDVSNLYRQLVDDHGGDAELAKRSDPRVRAELIRIGVAARTHLDPSVFIGPVLAEAVFMAETCKQPTVITDLRFTNEFEALAAFDFKFCYVARTGVPGVADIGDWGTDNWAMRADLGVDNSGDTDELAQRVEAMVEAFDLAQYGPAW